MKKCEHDLIEDECFQCLRALVKEQDETVKENMRAMSAGVRYRAALQAICDLDEVSGYSDTYRIAHEALHPQA